MTAHPSRAPGERSREEILDVAAQLMGERGYDGTSIATVAEAARVPKSLVFHHFRSKSALLSAVLSRGAQQFYDAMRRVHADPPSEGTHVERLSWYLLRGAEAYASHQSFHRLHIALMMTGGAADPEISRAIRELRAEGRAYMRQMIASSFADLGEETAARIAAELDAFGLIGFDGSVISALAEPAPLEGHIRMVARAMAALGEATLARS